MTDECRTILDEALSVDNKSQLTAKALSHIESCSQCRRSLEAVEALKTSVGSVLVKENNSALKARISNKLASKLEARRISATAKSSTLLPIIGLGVSAFVAVGLFNRLSSSNESLAIKEEVPAITTEVTVATQSEKLDKLSFEDKKKEYLKANQDLFKDGYNGDLKDYEPITAKTQSVPSSKADN